VTGGPRFGLILAGLLLGLFAVGLRPEIQSGHIPGDDAQEYVHLAAALLHGAVLVDYDGPPRLTRYTIGFPLLLAPAIAFGGLEAAAWVSYIAALLLGVLAAVIAQRLGGGLAAPLAVLLTLYTPAGFLSAQTIMSDLPSATVALGEVALLAFGAGGVAAAVAGVLGGGLIWIRPGTLALALAGLAGLTATRAVRMRCTHYLVGLLPFVLLLLVWQWRIFGSPFVSSYQAATPGATPPGLDQYFRWLTFSVRRGTRTLKARARMAWSTRRHCLGSIVTQAGRASVWWA
jgi:hypothetical protein